MLQEKLETIFYYLATKRFAISKMIKFLKPLDDERLEEIQIIYGIYFNSLLSLIDYIEKDLNQGSIKDICYNIFGCKNNFSYVKELRNSIIHRGLNVANACCDIEGIENLIVPMAPPSLSNRTNNKAYNTFVGNLFQLVSMAEKINQYIYEICNHLKLLEYKPMTKELFHKIILNDLYIPEYAKQMAFNTDVDYNQINIGLKKLHEDRIRKYFNTNDLFLVISKNN